MSSGPLAVAVIGSGNIGRTLAGAFARGGLAVALGVRDPGSPSAQEAAAALGGGVPVLPVADAVAGAGAVVLAVPGAAVDELLTSLGAALDGKVVVDATNNMAAAAPGGLLHDAELLARVAPRAAYARAFNTLGWENFAQPVFGEVQADLLWAGPDGDDGAVVERLVEAVGLRPVRIGGAADAGVLDGVTRLWFQLAFKAGLGRRVAFKVLQP